MKTTMKKTILTNIKLIAFGIVFAIGASYAYGAFSLPTGGAPGANIAIPLHTGMSQNRAGALSTGTFVSESTAAFDQNIFVEEQTIYGGTLGDTVSTIQFGDTDTVYVQSNGSIKVKDFIRAQDLATGAIHPVCADNQGNIVFCP